MSNLKKTLRTAKRSVKKTSRKISRGILTAATVGAMIPYRIEKEKNATTGDNGLAVTSLLLRTEISPACEDSEKSKTLLAVRLRPLKEIREDIRRFESIGKKKPKVEPPVPLTPEEEKALKKARKKAKKIEKKIAKKRAKKAAKEMARCGETA